MKAKQIGKVITDILMTAVLLLLMAYSLVGETAHEWLGVGMFALVILHHVLNSRWSRNVAKGRYTPFRVVQTMLVVLALVCMLGSMVSGIMISRHAFAFLKINAGQSLARTAHLLSAYWGFVVIPLHLGLHWNMVISRLSPTLRRVLLFPAVLIAGYGAFAFFKREIGSYLLLQNQFVFFDFGEPLIFFLLDYLAVMGLFIFLGHFLGKLLKR